MRSLAGWSVSSYFRNCRCIPRFRHTPIKALCFRFLGLGCRWFLSRSGGLNWSIRFISYSDYSFTQVFQVRFVKDRPFHPLSPPRTLIAPMIQSSASITTPPSFSHGPTNFPKGLLILWKRLGKNVLSPVKGAVTTQVSRKIALGAEVPRAHPSFPGKFTVARLMTRFATIIANLFWTPIALMANPSTHKTG